MLEDRDGDGVYDHATTFADHLTLPAGAVWYRGSLYVASPPDVFRFTDTDNDGIADSREVVVTGWNHGLQRRQSARTVLRPRRLSLSHRRPPRFRHQDQDDREYKGKSSRIWRIRPDGTGLEWFAGGGFDNPVELVFTPAGETIGTMTYFKDPANGERDALLHFVEGGVYPKWYTVVDEFKRTGDLMPVMTKFARIAPAGLMRYRGTCVRPAIPGQSLQRAIQSAPDSAPRTAPGGRIVPDRGHRLPDLHGSRLSSDRRHGGRRRQPAGDGHRRVVHPRLSDFAGSQAGNQGRNLPNPQDRRKKSGGPQGRETESGEPSPVELAKLLSDPRPAVQDRVIELLVTAGEAAVAPLTTVLTTAPARTGATASGATPNRAASVGAMPAVATATGATPNRVLPGRDQRCGTICLVFALFRIGTPKAQEAIRER